MILYKESNNTMLIITTGSDTNDYEGFMNCLKLPNKHMCETCNNNNTCFRQCGTCNNQLCI